MGFKENLLKKIRINTLADQILRSMGAPGSEQRLDRDLMRELLAMGDYDLRHERDLDLYLHTAEDGTPLILVLDNELKIYRTTVADVVLRKSPTIKEMISIRNAVKILSDASVVVTRKADTLERVRSRLIGALELSFTAADIEALARDGRNALENHYTEGILETLTLFAELLGFVKAPRPFQLAHHHIWGKLEKSPPDEMRFGPMVVFSLMSSRLKMFRGVIGNRDKAALEAFEQAAGRDGQADLEGPEVWEALKNEVLSPPAPGV